MMVVNDFSGNTIYDPDFVVQSGTVYQNATIVYNQPRYIAFKGYGSLGSMTNIVETGANYVKVINPSIPIVGKLAFMINEKGVAISPLDGGRFGMWARVEAIEGNKVIFDRLLDEEYPVDTMYVPYNIENVTFRNIKIVGNLKLTYGIRMYLAKNIHVENVIIEGANYTGISLESCLDSSVAHCYGNKADHSTGAAYGVAVVGGCDGVNVTGGAYSDMRHGVSVGGTQATSRNITITGVNTNACSDAGIDVHPNCMNAIINGNTVRGNSSRIDQAGDGICIQGVSGIVSNNTITNIRREGILVQPLTNSNGEFIVSNNIINKSKYGVLVDNYQDNDIVVNVSDNIIDSTGRALLLQGRVGGSIFAEVRGFSKVIADGRMTKITMFKPTVKSIEKAGEVEVIE